LSFTTTRGSYAITAEWGDVIQPGSCIGGGDAAPGDMKVYVGVEVAVQAGEAYYNPLNFSVADQDGYSYTWSGGCGIKGELGNGTLQAGRRVKGVVVFEVPAATKRLILDYRSSDGGAGSWLLARVPPPAPGTTPAPTPPPAGVTLNLTLSGGAGTTLLKGFYPSTTACSWGTSPSDSGVHFLERVNLLSSDMPGTNVSWLVFEDTDGPGKLPATFFVNLASGFDTLYFFWDPIAGDAGKITYSKTFDSVIVDVYPHEPFSGTGAVTHIKGTIKCAP
jgi:hypothetical protein